MPEIVHPDPLPDAAGDGAEPLLVFRLRRALYAIRIDAIDSVAESKPVRRVPGASPAISGLSEWGGRILTVIDLPRLLADRGDAQRACLVRLAAPMGHIALHVPAAVRLGRAPLSTRQAPDPGDRAWMRGTIEHEGVEFKWIDPERLVDWIAATAGI